MLCPEKNTKDWKNLLIALGSEEACYRAWIANNYEIPTLDQLTDEKFKDVIPEKKVQPKFQAAIDNLIQKRVKLNNNLNSQKTDRKAYKITQKQIELIDEEINKLGKLSAVEDIIEHANNQLSEVSKILNSDNLTENDFLHAKNTINLWMKAGDFTNNENIFFSPEEIENSDNEDSDLYDIRNKFLVFGRKANALSNQWIKKREGIINNWLQTSYGKSFHVSVNDVLEDIGLGKSFLLDISKTDYVLIQAMYDWNSRASQETSKEAGRVVKGLSKVFEGLNKKYSKKQLYEMLSQEVSNTDHRKTGDLVYRFSQKYFDWKSELWSGLKSKLKYSLELQGTERNKFISNAWQEFNNEYRKNNTVIDVRKLFPDTELYGKPFTDEEIAAHKNELINILGNKGYLENLERAGKKVEKYKSDREVELEDIRDKVGDNEAAVMQEIEKWDLENSPYYYAEQFETGFKQSIGGKLVSPKGYNSQVVPKKIVEGKNTDFYDSKFSAIENDSDLYNVYQYLLETLHEINTYLPEDLKEEIHINTLPKIKKNLLELFTGGELANGYKGIWDAFKEAQREGIGGTVEPTYQTDVNGNKIRTVNTDFLTQDTQRIKDYVDRQTIIYKQSNPDVDVLKLKKLRKDWSKDIKNVIAEESTFDIEKVIKVYSLAAISYKHKSQIEDSMQLAHSFMQDLVKSKENLSGESMKDQFGNIKPDTKAPENLAKQLEYFMDNFYGDKTKAVELATKQKVYTEEENKIKAEIEELLGTEISDSDKLLLYKQLNSLGGYRTGGRLIDMANQYIRMKGLAYNPFAAIINASIGYLSNITEGSGGRVYTQDQLNKGYKEYLFNSKKVEAIMEKYSILEEIQSEIYNSPKYAKSKKWFEPFGLQHKTEMLNQAPVAVAVLLHKKVMMDGKEVSYYDVLDDDGNLLPGVDLAENYEFKAIQLIKETIKDIHGNYDKDAPILANKYILGRSLLVFRKWMLNSFYNRLGSERYSLAKEMTDKGRWISYGTYFREYGALAGTKDLALNFLKKFAFGKFDIHTNFDEKLSEVDAANMRKNLTELMFLTVVSALALLLKATSDDDEDKVKYLCFFWINNLTRIQTDMLFYVDPQQFKTILRDPVPVAVLITDAQKTIGRTLNLLGGGEDEYQQGPHKGQSKAGVAWKKMIPGLSIGDRFDNMYQQIFQKDQFLMKMVSNKDENK